MENGTENCISQKDIYKESWEGRNFEISHLWQRSVFLAVFMLAIASAYGKTIFNMVFEMSEIENITYQQHIVALVICYLGMIFSMLWIMMGKGSKYWYEKYEQAIDWYIYNSDIFGEISEEEPYHGNLPKIDTSENLFSTMAARYSVSRVNIAIGIIALIVYSFLTVIHFGEVLDKNFEFLTRFQCAIFGVLQLIFAFTVMFMFIKKLCKSGSSNE